MWRRIKEDIHWLGFDWGDRFFYGSDYFEEDYRQAVGLIKKGLAYVCQLSPEEFKAHRGDIWLPLPRHRIGIVPLRRVWISLPGCGQGSSPTVP